MKIEKFNERISFNLWYNKYNINNMDDMRYLDQDLDDIEKNKIKYYLYNVSDYICIYFNRPSMGLKSTYYNSSFENITELKTEMLERNNIQLKRVDLNDVIKDIRLKLLANKFNL